MTEPEASAPVAAKAGRKLGTAAAVCFGAAVAAIAVLFVFQPG